MKNKTSKLAKLERERYSVFHDGKSCYICGSEYELTWDEIFKGRNRRNSMKYGFCVRLCLDCHRRINEDYEYIHNWQVKGQQYFEEHYGARDDFISIFYRNYL